MEVARSRDLIIYKKGDAFAVAVSPDLAVSGWSAGQGAQWYDSGRDEITVSLSDGLAEAFFLWGSDETADKFTSMSRNQPTYKFAVVGMGGWIISTSSFERYTYATRGLPNPTPIVYTPSEDLFYSLSGKLTNEDEWSLSGDPRAPNDNVVGVAIQAPSFVTSNYITVHMKT
jgi:hypothetical protein